MHIVKWVNYLEHLPFQPRSLHESGFTWL